MSDRAERREYIRVDDVLPLQYVRLDREAARSARARFLAPDVLSGPAPPAEPLSRGVSDDPIRQIGVQLAEIQSRLDYLIRHLVLRQETQETTPRDVNLSGSGLRFEAEEPLAAGEILEIRIVLPFTPPVALATLGEVVWVDPPSGTPPRYSTAVRFVQLPEDARSCILRYTFQRQRELHRRP